MEVYNEITAVFMPANTASILQPKDQGVISIFKSYWRNKFPEATVAIDGDSFDGSGQITLKTFWKGFALLAAINNLCDLWEVIRILT